MKVYSTHQDFQNWSLIILYSLVSYTVHFHFIVAGDSGIVL